MSIAGLNYRAHMHASHDLVPQSYATFCAWATKSSSWSRSPKLRVPAVHINEGRNTCTPAHLISLQTCRQRSRASGVLVGWLHTYAYTHTYIYIHARVRDNVVNAYGRLGIYSYAPRGQSCVYTGTARVGVREIDTKASIYI